MNLQIIRGVFLAVIILLLPSRVLAEEKINSFDTNIVAHKDGTMTVTESIVYDFGDDNRHGIFREIPLVSQVGELFRIIEIDFNEVKRDGKDENFEVEKRSKTAEIKIGDPDKEITGKHNYIIIYTVKNGIGSNYEDHDEIYWNATGNEWQIPIENASYQIETDFGALIIGSVCYTGPVSSKFQNCQISGNKITTTEELGSYQGLTVATKFPVNTFPKSVLSTSEPVFDPDFINLLKIYLPIIFILNFIVAPAILYKYFKSRRGKNYGKAGVNFDIPKDLSPAEAGIIDNATLERNDVIAGIFDLAIKKFLKIEEVKVAKTLRPDETDYKFIKLKEYQGEDKFNQHLMEDLFSGRTEILMKDLKADFYKTFNKLETAAFSSLIKKNFYTKNPKGEMMFLLVIGIIILFIGNIILGLVLIFLSRKLTGRTEKGDQADHQIEGLKIFLKAMSRHHKFQSKNLIAVEKYIPFAIALGLQNEFMDQLKVIDPNYNPSWYSGNHGFYYVYPSMYSSMGSNMTTSAPSSSSGFSGGSSGGGGGGGGGSW